MKLTFADVLNLMHIPDKDECEIAEPRAVAPALPSFRPHRLYGREAKTKEYRKHCAFWHNDDFCGKDRNRVREQFAQEDIEDALGPDPFEVIAQMELMEEYEKAKVMAAPYRQSVLDAPRRAFRILATQYPWDEFANMPESFREAVQMLLEETREAARLVKQAIS